MKPTRSFSLLLLLSVLGPAMILCGCAHTPAQRPFMYEPYCSNPARLQRIAIFPIVCTADASVDKLLTPERLRSLNRQIGAQLALSLTEGFRAKGYRVEHVPATLCEAGEWERLDTPTRGLLAGAYRNLEGGDELLLQNVFNVKEDGRYYRMQNPVAELCAAAGQTNVDAVVLVRSHSHLVSWSELADVGFAFYNMRPFRSSGGGENRSGHSLVLVNPQTADVLWWNCSVGGNPRKEKKLAASVRALLTPLPARSNSPRKCQGYQGHETEEIFAAAIEIAAPVERAVYLERVCGENQLLRREVESLLVAHEQAGAFLDDPETVHSSAKDLRRNSSRQR